MSVLFLFRYIRGESCQAGTARTDSHGPEVYHPKHAESGHSDHSRCKHTNAE